MLALGGWLLQGQLSRTHAPGESLLRSHAPNVACERVQRLRQVFEQPKPAKYAEQVLDADAPGRLDSLQRAAGYSRTVGQLRLREATQLAPSHDVLGYLSLRPAHRKRGRP
jgi:hypothetical protein